MNRGKQIYDVPADVCADCPARGACVGDVGVRLIELTLLDVNRIADMPAARVFLRDSQWEESWVIDIAPATHPVRTRIFGRTTPTTPIDKRVFRSDRVFSTINEDPKGFLGELAKTAEQCTSGGTGICGTFERQALDATARKLND